jgi:hypothetical protein
MQDSSQVGTRSKALREAAHVGMADIDAGRYRTFESRTELRQYLGKLGDEVRSRRMSRARRR